MNDVFSAVALLLTASFGAALWRAARGPTAADRLAASQVLGSIGVALLLLLAEITGERAPRDVALLLAMFALVVTAAFVRRLASGTGKGDDDD